MICAQFNVAVLCVVFSALINTVGAPGHPKHEEFTPEQEAHNRNAFNQGTATTNDGRNGMYASVMRVDPNAIAKPTWDPEAMKKLRVGTMQVENYGSRIKFVDGAGVNAKNVNDYQYGGKI